MVDYESLRNSYQRPIDPVQVAAIEQIVHDYSPKRVLEVGCATGRLLGRLEKLGCNPVGLDLSMGALQKNRNNLPAVQANGNVMPFGDDVFALVIANHVVEHTRDVAGFVGELARVTEPGGKIFLSYPAEPIRGLFASLGSVFLFGHPFAGRKMHLHKVRPTDFDQLAESIPIAHIDSWRRFMPMPQYLTVLVKQAVV